MKKNLITRKSAIKTILGGGFVAFIGYIIDIFANNLFVTIVSIVGYLIIFAGSVLMILVAIKENDSK